MITKKSLVFGVRMPQLPLAFYEIILHHKSNPRLDTFGIVLKGLGFKLTIEPDKSQAS